MEAPATAEFPGPRSINDVEVAFEEQNGQSQGGAAPEATSSAGPAAAAAETPPVSAAQAPRSDQQHHLPAATSQGHHSGAEGRRAEPSSSNPASESGAQGLSSKYLGVSWNSARGRWTAKIANGRVQESLGMFDAEEDAARAFDKAAVRGHGREAELNFPEEAGSHHRRRRGLAAYDSDPEISAESEGGDGPQDVDDEIAPPKKGDDKEKRKPARRKRPRLVPPHSRSSKYRGVYWEPKGSKWYSSISSNHKQIHLGSFNTEEEAAQAFDQEAIRLRGPGTFTNFPSENYLIGDVDSDSGQPKKSTQRRPPNGIRRRSVKKGEEPGAASGAVVEFERPEKDDQAANALLSLGCSLPRRAGKPKAPVAVPGPGNVCTGSTPPRTIEPPVTLRGQKRKRGGLTTGGQRTEGSGRARSKFTGVYQQSRGNGWFASICVDKSMRYLGTFPSEEEAARAFDQEAIRLRGTGIELNLPHEAEGFMQKLRAEEEALAAAGESVPERGGPAPLVSAGPDSVEPPATALTSTQPPRPPAAVPLGPGAADAPARLEAPRRHKSLDAGMNGRPSLGRTFSESNQFVHDADGALPSWDGRRARTAPKKVKRADKKALSVAPPPMLSWPSSAAAPGLSSGPAARPSMDAGYDSYPSLLVPSVGGMAAFGAFSAPGSAPPPPFSMAAPQGHVIQPASLAAPQLARPAASYASHGGIHALGPSASGASSFSPVSGVLQPAPSRPQPPSGPPKGPLALRNGSAALQIPRPYGAPQQAMSPPPPQIATGYPVYRASLNHLGAGGPANLASDAQSYGMHAGLGPLGGAGLHARFMNAAAAAADAAPYQPAGFAPGMSAAGLQHGHAMPPHLSQLAAASALPAAAYPPGSQFEHFGFAAAPSGLAAAAPAAGFLSAQGSLPGVQGLQPVSRPTGSAAQAAAATGGEGQPPASPSGITAERGNGSGSLQPQGQGSTSIGVN